MTTSSGPDGDRLGRGGPQGWSFGIDSLRWLIGLYCALFGALALVSPFQLGPASTALPRLDIQWFGAGLLVSGGALILTLVGNPSRGYAILAYGAAGAGLLLLALRYILAGAWAPGGVFGVLAVGTMLAPLLGRRRSGPQPDLLLVLVGLGAFVNGLLLVLVPGQYAGRVGDSVGSVIPAFAAAFMVIGLALVVTEVLHRTPRTVRTLVCCLAGALFLAWLVTVPLPIRLWTGILYYAGFGLVLTVQPWLGPRLQRIDATSLQVRMALLLAAAAALPLIVAATLVTEREEAVRISEALAVQRVVASTVANEARDLMRAVRGAAEVLALQMRLFNPPPGQQAELLGAVAGMHPELLELSVRDARGQLIASSRPEMTDLASGRPVTGEAEPEGARVSLAISPSLRLPVVVVAEPIVQDDGAVQGYVEATLATSSLLGLLMRPDAPDAGAFYLVDDRGRVIAHQFITGTLADLSAVPPVAALLEGPPGVRSLIYHTPGGNVLASYASVPEVGWGVVVERPEAVALAATRANRELGFLVLLLCIAAAGGLGAAIAGRLTAPLAALAFASDRLAAGDLAPLLPRTGMPEIAELATAFGTMRDRLALRTAERDRVEAALRLSEASFRLIFASNPLPMWVADAETDAILEANTAAVTHYGYSHEEFLGLRTSDISAEAMPPVAAVGEADVAGSRWVCECRHRRKDGGLIDVELSVHATEFRGRPAVLVVARDVTEQKRAEAERAEFAMRQAAAAREIEARNHELELLHELDEAMLASFDLDLMLNQVLTRAAEVGGYDLGSIRLLSRDGERLETVASYGYRDPASALRRRSAALDAQTGEYLFISMEHRGPHIIDDVPSTEGYRTFKQEGVISVILVPVRVEDRVLGTMQIGTRHPHHFQPTEVRLLESVGAHIGIAVQRARLTEEMRQAYAELQATEEGRARLATIIEATPDLVAIARADGQRIYMNRAGRRLLGYHEDDDISQSRASDNRPEWARANLLEEAFAIAARDGVYVYETAYLGPDGREIPTLSVLIAHRDEAGKVEYYSTIARDITQLKQMEAQLLRAGRLETAGRVAGQVAHDFNNLLAPLVGYPELIKMRLPEGHPAVAYCDAMLEAAQQMATISEDLLALGRRGHFNQEPTDINRLVQQVLAHLEPPPATLHITRELAEELLPVSGAAAQLVRVLSNLITNAREAMADVGQLTVRTENVYLDQPFGRYNIVAVGEYVRVDVSDTGVGIPPEIRDRIFDAFFTTKQAGRRRGSGLGLSVVQSIVEDHRGYLDVQSEVGVGTTFSLYLPICRDALPTSARDGVVGGSERILIVDDDEGQREVARDLLETLGYSVGTVASGELALAYLKDHEVDLLVLDMVMPPGMDGAETYRRVLELHPHQRAIIVSGYAESERVRLAQQLGAGAYVRKPVTRERLARAVRAELDRERSPALTP